jgi:hypothetical protein
MGLLGIERLDDIFRRDYESDIQNNLTNLIKIDTYLQETQGSLQLLRKFSRLLYSKKGSQMQMLSLRLRTSIFQISLSIYLSSIIYHYMKGNWLHAANDLGRISIYLSDQSSEIPLEISDETDIKESKKDLISVWMKYLLVSKLDSILSNLDYKEYDQWMEESLLEFNYLDPNMVFMRSKTELPKKQIDRRLGPGGW